MAFNHKRRSDTAEDGRIADSGGGADDVSFQDDAIFFEKFIFWLGKTLVGDDLAENLLGGVGLGVELGHRFVEFAGESGGGIVLRSGGEAADVAKIFNKPLGTAVRKGAIDEVFVER